MRRITTFSDRKKMEPFLSFLLREHIEFYIEKEGEESVLWIKNEDQIFLAKKYYEAFLDGTLQERMDTPKEEEEPKVDIEESLQKIKIVEDLPLKKEFRAFCTRICIVLCFLVYALSFYQRGEMGKGGKYLLYLPTISPIQATLLYDFPKAYALSNQLNEEYPIDTKEEIYTLPENGKGLILEIQENPPWPGLYGLFLTWKESGKGFSGKLFEKISEGEVWRILTPIFLHGDILHILFNMLWLWLLGKMVEDTMKSGSYLLFIFITAAITNTLQYLMSGPLFMGFSGVITALGGYVFVRQKKAPWELFPIDRNTLIFLWIFIFGSLAIQIIAFFLQFFHIGFLPMRIANTAHISGLFLGMGMARMKIFQRKL